MKRTIWRVLFLMMMTAGVAHAQPAAPPKHEQEVVAEGVMVHRADDFRAMWPALVLVFLGLHFAAAGSGKLGLDTLMFGGGRRSG